jgi:hypothetical protein
VRPCLKKRTKEQKRKRERERERERERKRKRGREAGRLYCISTAQGEKNQNLKCSFQ